MRKTIKKVTTVVAVLMTNCHGSEKRKNGPGAAQRRINKNDTPKAQHVPTPSAALQERRRNHSLPPCDFFSSMHKGKMGQALSSSLRASFRESRRRDAD